MFTREFALSRSERITTAAAVLLSSAGYVLGHHAYLTRGVVGDLAGLVLLAGALVARGQRSRQEALVCLVLIGVVLALRPAWPLARSDQFWWSLFFVGLTGYVLARKRVCK